MTESRQDPGQEPTTPPYDIGKRAIAAGYKPLQIPMGVAKLLKRASPEGIGLGIRLVMRGDFSTLLDHMRRFAQAHDVSPLRRSALVVQAEPWPAELPLVSVVIACSNKGEHLEETIDSVFAQTAAAL